MRTGLRRSVGVALLVLVTGAGLFAMHLLVVTAGAADGTTAAHDAHASPSMNGHASASHSEVGTHRAHGSVVERAMHSASEHRHELLGCLWLLAAAVAVVVAVRTTRLRDRDGHLPAAHWRHHGTSQRAPPLATRLALVGVSRR